MSTSLVHTTVVVCRQVVVSYNTGGMCRHIPPSMCPQGMSRQLVDLRFFMVLHFLSNSSIALVSGIGSIGHLVSVLDTGI